MCFRAGQTQWSTLPEVSGCHGAFAAADLELAAADPRVIRCRSAAHYSPCGMQRAAAPSSVSPPADPFRAPIPGGSDNVLGCGVVFPRIERGVWYPWLLVELGEINCVDPVCPGESL